MGFFRRTRGRSLERQSPPAWSVWRPGRRVLVEHRDPVYREILERRLRASGYDALGCAGPVDETNKVSCPLLRQEPCPAVEGADAIVSGLDFRRDANRFVAARIAQARPDCPLLLDTPDLVIREWGASFPFERVYRMTAPTIIRRLEALFETASEG